jgi:signal transduction histidine kinase
MGQLIDDLLLLSRVGRGPLHLGPVDVTAMAREVARGLCDAAPERRVEWDVQEGLVAHADARLLRIALENLLGNALKFTAQRPVAHIRVAAHRTPEGTLFSVEDDGVGFDMTYAGKLFTPFQRLHRERDFPGTGIGLATVQRIARRHGGRTEAEGQVGQGARFALLLPDRPAAAAPGGGT